MGLLNVEWFIRVACKLKIRSIHYIFILNHLLIVCERKIVIGFPITIYAHNVQSSIW
jgi:hypothetical protein